MFITTFDMTKINISDSLVSVHLLAENLNAENLVILDASMKPVTPVKNSAQAAPVYIQGALRFDIDHEMSAKSTSLPHMMPSPEVFTEKVQELGSNKNSAIVAYGQVGIYSSPRHPWLDTFWQELLNFLSQRGLRWRADDKIVCCLFNCGLIPSNLITVTFKCFPLFHKFIGRIP